MKLLLLALAFVACACHATPAPIPEREIVIVIPDGGAGTCGDACARMREFGCPEGNPSPGGTTCEAVCINAGPTLLDPACVAGATSREGLKLCNVRCIR